MGGCAIVLYGLSILLVVLLFPFSLCFTIKVNISIFFILISLFF